MTVLLKMTSAFPILDLTEKLNTTRVRQNLHLLYYLADPHLFWKEQGCENLKKVKKRYLTENCAKKNDAVPRHFH